MHDTPDPAVPAPELLDLFLPLHFFYSAAKRELPEVGFASPDEIPEPYRKLLVHNADMTSRLREHHGEELVLRVLEKQESNDYLVRMVVLATVESGKPVEFGAIGIHLEQFPSAARARIVEGKTPLGAIIEQERVAYKSAPREYFGMYADAIISEALHAEPGELLYGRCNTLITPDVITMADIVEVLPKGMNPC